jgi:hypothetical protein
VRKALAEVDDLSDSIMAGPAMSKSIDRMPLAGTDSAVAAACHP